MVGVSQGFKGVFLYTPVSQSTNTGDGSHQLVKRETSSVTGEFIDSLYQGTFLAI